MEKINWLEFYERPYADDDEKLNDFVQDTLRRVSWKLFENQKSVVHMAYETESGIPQFKDGAVDYIAQIIDNELGWLRSYMVNRILIAYVKSNIEMSEQVEDHFYFDFEPEDYADFRKQLDDYIWNDYAENLGEERTAELWEKWGKAPRKEN